MRGDRPSTVLWLHRLMAFTPHARGSTCTGKRLFLGLTVYPACAGIDRVYGLYNIGAESLPRMRGDRPRGRSRMSGACEFTPHARGSTWHSDALSKSTTVYPACAGIDLGICSSRTQMFRLPRMRGDRPQAPKTKLTLHRFTPHARGSTLVELSGKTSHQVYPACAGIDLKQDTTKRPT